MRLITTGERHVIGVNIHIDINLAKRRFLHAVTVVIQVIMKSECDKNSGTQK